MCTVITLQRPGQAWPLLMAANRDERLDRPWDPPAAYWPAQPGVVGGRDRLGGGTWMACHAEKGLVAAVLNRPGSLGPAPDKRSRGDLPLMALGCDTAEAAAARISQLDGAVYRSFNLVVADAASVWFIRGLGEAAITASRMTPGLHMITAHDPDDLTSPRVARHRPRFAAAEPPEPPNWTIWRGLLGDEAGPPAAALSVPGSAGFGTVCASLFGLRREGGCTWQFASGKAADVPFHAVAGLD